MADEAKAKGNAAFFAGRFNEAIRFFSEAIDLAPSNHVLYSNRSAAYASLNRYADALADAKKTVEIKPDWSKGYSRLGFALLGLGSAEDAVAAYRKGLDLDPSNEALKSGLADAQAASRSRASFGNRFQGPDDEDVSFITNRAPVYLEMGKEGKREEQKTMAAKQMSLTLLVDEKRKRVIYAESGKDFVETLLSFLTLPLGTVIKLSRKQSRMGSFTMLYQSLEDFDLEFLSTESCKDMLLNPKSSAVELYKNVHPMFDLGAIKPTQYYVCSSWKHVFEELQGSTVENDRCHCGKTMNCRIYEEKGAVDAVGGDGVFLKGNMRFMIRDDLRVSVVSSSTCFALLRELGISDASVLVERKVIVGEEEVLHLLKCLLLSKTPLTDVFLGQLNTIDVVDLDLNVTCHDSKDNQSQSEKEMGDDSKKMNVKLIMGKSNHRVLYAGGGEEFIDLLFCFLSFHLGAVAKCLGGCTGVGYFNNLVGAQSQTDKEMGGDSKKMNVKLFLSKSNKRILYAEGGAEFTDLLFSFLTFPLGSIVKCLGGCTDTGCLDNLYKSAEDLSCKDCMISEGCKAILLDPKLPPYFGTKNQLLQIEEQVPHKPKFVCCATCRGSAGFITSPWMCYHLSRRDLQLSTTNPKFPGAVTELGGAFVAGQAMFMVTDELAVKPLSTISGISLLSKFNMPISDIEEEIVCIGEKEAMSLLKASLVSNSVLSNVFYPKKQKQMDTKSKSRIFSAQDII